MNRDTHNLCNLYMEDITPYYDAYKSSYPENMRGKNTIPSFVASPLHVNRTDIKEDLKNAINNQPVKVFDLVRKTGAKFSDQSEPFKTEFTNLMAKLMPSINYFDDPNYSNYLIGIINDQIFNENKEFYHFGPYKTLMGNNDENALPILSFRAAAIVSAIDKFITNQGIIDSEDLNRLKTLFEYRNLLVNFVQNQNGESLGKIDLYSKSHPGLIDTKQLERKINFGKKLENGSY